MGFLEDVGRTQPITRGVGFLSNLESQIQTRQTVEQESKIKQFALDKAQKEETRLNTRVSLNAFRAATPNMSENQFNHLLETFKGQGFDTANDSFTLRDRESFTEFLNTDVGKQKLIENATIGLTDTRQAIEQSKAAMSPDAEKPLNEKGIEQEQQKLQGLIARENLLLNSLEGLGIKKGIGAEPVKRAFKVVPDESSSTGFSFKDLESGQFFGEAPKPSSLVSINLPKPASASERTAIAEGEAAIDSLNNIKSLFDASFVGPIAGRAGTVGELFGANTLERSEFIAATAAFKNQIIKEITGAQMSEIEANRILKQVPDVNNPPSVWQARWNQSLKNIEFLQIRRNEILRKSGIKAPGSEAEEVTDLTGLTDEDLLKEINK